MNKIIFLMLVVPTSLMYAIPEDWPVFNPKLTPEQMYKEAGVILNVRELFSIDPVVDRLQYTGSLYEQYIRTAAKNGHEPAVEWVACDAYTRVEARNEAVSPDTLDSIAKQVRQVKDLGISSRSHNFLRLARAALSLRK